MEINQDVTSDPYLKWLGWDRTGNTPTNGACIHHPEGDVMKISIEDDAFTTAIWNGLNSSNEYNHWEVDFDEGIAESGSSGSPLFNENHKVVGQMHGGITYQDPCNQTVTWFGKFNIAWNGGGTSDSQLSYWLDPIGTNLQTMDSCSPLSILGPTVPGASSAYSLNNLPNGYSVSWAWKNGSTKPITSGIPTAISCTIYNMNKTYINDVLVATISIGGNNIRTVEKPIRTGANFSGTYKQAGGSVDPPLGSGLPTYYAPIPETTFADNATILIHREHKVTLKSSLFSTSTISVSGPTPSLSLTQNGDSIT